MLISITSVSLDMVYHQPVIRRELFRQPIRNSEIKAEAMSCLPNE
jgi:hypothetical protein